MRHELSPESRADVYKAGGGGAGGQTLLRSIMCKSSFAKAWRAQATKHGKRVPRIGGRLKSKGGEVGNVERTQAGWQRVLCNKFRCH